MTHENVYLVKRTAGDNIFQLVFFFNNFLQVFIPRHIPMHYKTIET